MRFPANLPFLELQSMVEAAYNRLTELTALAPIPAFSQRKMVASPSPEFF